MSKTCGPVSLFFLENLINLIILAVHSGGSVVLFGCQLSVASPIRAHRGRSLKCCGILIHEEVISFFRDRQGHGLGAFPLDVANLSFSAPAREHFRAAKLYIEQNGELEVSP